MIWFRLMKVICWIFGHQWIEDPGIERNGVTEPLYYKGWTPYCDRCKSDIDESSEQKERA